MLPAQAKILDLGCGSGKPIAQYLLHHAHTLVGVDCSDVMLDMAQKNFPRADFPQVNWIQADMRQLDLNTSFDGIVAWDSFFHLTTDDQKAMFQRFSMHSKKGTALLFTSGPEAGEAIGDLFGDALYHASLSPEEYRDLFQYYAFEEILMIAEDQTCTGHTVWLVRKIRD